MKLVELDKKKGIYKIIIEDEDDLWVLRNILKPGDLVEALTTREVKPGEGGSSRRLPMALRIRVKEVEFQPFTDRLRIKGVVVEGPEDFGVVGKHHTLSVKPGDTVILVEKELSGFDIKLLEEFSGKRRILAVALDYDEVCYALVTEQGIKVLREYSASLPGKGSIEDYEEAVEKYIEEVVENTIELARSLRAEGVVVGSPGFLKDRVQSLLRSRGLEKPLYADSVAYGGCKGVEELVRRGSERELFRELRIISAVKYFEEFKKALSQDPDSVAYGLDTVAQAVRLNAVRVLLVSSSLVWSSSESESRAINEIIVEAFEKGAEVYIVPEDASIRPELDGFGGIIALLRFKLSFYQGSAGEPG
ncbi:mRNA surveillance protein pelota [Thermogladius sp. 4427co]|uniref:mRNA surveillance protein pelota n=1 Tax=Thermogladius sp. 4427co TaxID=3450718 RepID=UPI003F79C968